MPRELIRRARSILRGQEFEGESGDREFDEINRINFIIDEKTIMVESKGVRVSTLTEVYRLKIDWFTNNKLECSFFREGPILSISFDSPVMGKFEETKGLFTIWKP